ncbi:MAG: nucleotidyltransferase [Niastella sp.]|nr:nucleotidyltransferase [Niastella sp.]
MKPTLLILAAGMASRYGSMKQTEGFGPYNETIMDYSIYDAIQAGFGKVVFIIREDFAENFKAIFEEKLKGKIEVEYVYQHLEAHVHPQYIPEGRTKPWGTGHAMLCAKDVIREPFAVINADDFYGTDGFMKASEFLQHQCNENTYAIIGYKLARTLSEHGTVSRGVCKTDESNNLVDIHERTKIYRNNQGKIVYEENDEKIEVPETSSVSMNFWCFHPSVFVLIEKLFSEFPKNNMDNLKAEFFIPLIGEHFIKTAGNNIQVIPTDAQWFGVTYKEDAPGVKQSIATLITAKAYPEKLF